MACRQQIPRVRTKLKLEHRTGKRRDRRLYNGVVETDCSHIAIVASYVEQSPVM
jgi:hypothetical protein